MLATFLGFLALFAIGGIAFAFVPRRPKGTRPRLTVWHRSAIALSVIWFLGMGMWAHEDNRQMAQRFMESGYRICSESQAAHGNYDFTGCMNQAVRDFEIMSGPGAGWPDVVIGVGLGLLLAWLVAYICLWSMRWILRGRPKETTA